MFGYTLVKTTEYNKLVKRSSRMELALSRIRTWFGEFPRTKQFDTFGDGHELSYGYCYGSNGERDYMRGIANDALVSKDLYETDSSLFDIRKGE